MKVFLRRHSLVIGVILMFLLTWPIDLANAGVLPFKVPLPIALLVGYGIVAASLIMTGITLGKSGVAALLRRFLLWRVGWKWYLTAFFLLPVMYIISVFLNAALSKTPVDFSTVLAYQIFGPSANLTLLIIPYFLFEVFTNGEEIGWRGYVLPRLQAKYSALVSTLIVGVIWGIWHIPKFIPHWELGVFAWVMVDFMAKAVLLTWIYNNTKGSLLLATLFHASGNTAGMMLPMANTLNDSNPNTRIISGILLVIAAVVVLVSAGPERLSRSEPKQVQD